MPVEYRGKNKVGRDQYYAILIGLVLFSNFW